MPVHILPFPEGDGPLAAGPADVHVWQAQLDQAGDLRGLLTRDEIARAERYRSPQVARQFVAARGLLRKLLARYLGCSPAAVPIAVRPDGKPEVPAVRFNVSHTNEVAVIAVSQVEVGVDVETVREVANEAALVERFFSAAEREQYHSLPAELRSAAFFRGWTGKEAVLKGIGCGTRDLGRCVVDLDPRHPLRVIGPPATAAMWSLTAWEPAPGLVAAVAYSRDART